jgi:hypothetical protein
VKRDPQAPANAPNAVADATSRPADWYGGTEVIYDVSRNPTVMPIRFTSVDDDLSVVVEVLRKTIVGLRAECIRNGALGSHLWICVSGGCDSSHLDSIVKAQSHAAGLRAERRTV